ncbi:MAG: helix-turn-helix domain-containing protein [Bacteroidales bacterium]|nr:helix-turn-helix domain-containing protein [Bacteroidales bacterium]MDD3893095.1 helix-turn-helix domain-containing protein [Bacteroidales bacterium]
MNIGDNIKRVREAKNLTQKEVIMAIDMGAAMYSRIESGKTEPSLTTLEKIAKALGVSLVELIQSDESMSDVNSVDKSLMEKLRLMEALNDEERKTIYTMLDAFIGKKKLKDALSNVLHDVH